MKKILIALISTATVFFTVVFTLGFLTNKKKGDFQIAMVTDFSDVNDASFNQACFEAAKEWCSKYDIDFTFYKPSSYSAAERVKSIRLAIDRGYNMILCPGFALGEAIAKVAPDHPEVKFLCIDIAKDDFKGYELDKNITVYNYYENLSGYLAGYAAVKDGYKNLSFVGGMEIPSVTRYGYGFIHGIDDAAQELKKDVEVQFVYSNQFFGDSEIYKYVDNLYKVNKTEVIFSCGGSIYTSIALASKENNGKMIGVDSDQAPIIDRDYEEGLCITSATKEIKKTVINKLEAYYTEGIWEENINFLGLECYEHPEQNYVQLPLEHWRFDNFTIEEYKTLVQEIIDGKRDIPYEVTSRPETSDYTTVNYLKDIK